MRIDLDKWPDIDAWFIKEKNHILDRLEGPVVGSNK